MTDFSVTNSATMVTTAGSLVQNLGPDDLYVDNVSTVTTASGLRVAAGETVAVGANNHYAISEGTSDVRVLSGGIAGPSS